MQQAPVVEPVERQPRGGLLTRSHVLRLVALGVLVAVLGALLAVRLTAAQRTAAKVQTAAPAYSLVGHTAPDFTLQVWNGVPGQVVHLSALRGKAVVINFWASWCYPCQQEAKVLEAGNDAYRSHGVVILGVALNTAQDNGIAFLKSYGVTYLAGSPVESEVAAAYGLVAIPQTVYVNPQGIVVSRDMGPVTSRSLAQGVQAITR